MARNDLPDGTARILAAPVRLPNGADATAEIWTGQRWVAAGPVFGDLQPITSYDGPTPETDAASDGPAWFYRLGEGE